MKSGLSGTLYVVATPIGNLADMSTRAIDTLQAADAIACEDTRHSKKLLDYYHINSRTVSYHEHSGAQSIEKILNLLDSGGNVALVSDGGTPLISDPGYRLVKKVRESGYQVIPIPGSCALIAALSVSGIATDRFSFIGFLPAKSGQRKIVLEGLRQYGDTIVFFESPHRILESLNDASTILGDDRIAFMAREISKRFETHFRGSLGELRDLVGADINQQRGEIVVVLGAASNKVAFDAEAERILLLSLAELPPSRAVSLTSKITGVDRSLLYQQALRISEGCRKD